MKQELHIFIMQVFHKYRHIQKMLIKIYFLNKRVKAREFFNFTKRTANRAVENPTYLFVLASNYLLPNAVPTPGVQEGGVPESTPPISEPSSIDLNIVIGATITTSILYGVKNFINPKDDSDELIEDPELDDRIYCGLGGVKEGGCKGAVVGAGYAGAQVLSKYVFR